jgi:hypothetical protein
VIEKPPIGGKELLPLTSVQLAGFRLHPGPVRLHLFLLVLFNFAYYVIGIKNTYFPCFSYLNNIDI